MSIEQLITEHLDIWTAADTEKKSGRGRSSVSVGSVYGIKKLRELILELAVRGKLVPQDDSDEPASELLKRIAAEKAKLVAAGKIKKGKPLEPIANDERPFELPAGWEWVRNGFIFNLRKGRIPKNLSENKIGLPYLDIEALDKGIIRRYSDDLTSPQSTSNDILVVCDGSRSGLVLKGKVGIIGSTLSIIDTPDFIQPYVTLIFRQSYERLNSTMKGAAIPHLDIQRLILEVIGLPPISEQHRIIAKVDELMALCDQLENQHNNAAEAHEKLATHLLGTLTQSQNAEDFNINWQRISEYFDTLFTTESSIDALKQTLLQLAVMGKLVPQDPNDEPASELLKDIVKTKDQLIKTKKYQKTGKLKQKELLVNYPESWVVVQTGEVCPSVVPSRDKPKSFSGDIPWITLPSFPSDGWYLDTSTLDLGLTLEEASEYTARIIPERSVLMSCVGRFGLTAINQIPVIPNQQIHAFIIISGLVPEFLCIVIQAVVKQMEDMATSTTIPYLNKSNCESIEFGLPPFLEQTRIVAKVDELMAVCDQLKSQITSANQLQQKLADVLIEQAVE